MGQYIDVVKPKVAKAAMWSIIISFIVITLIYLESLLKPFFIAFFLWFLIKELKALLRKIKIKGKKLPHYATAILAFTIIILFLAFLFEIISSNIGNIADNMPDYESKFDTFLDQISQSINSPNLMDNLENWIKDMNLASMAGSVANTLSSFIGNSIIVLIYLIFMLLEEYVFEKKVNKLFPVKDEKFDKIKSTLTSVNDSVKKYFISKTIASIILAICCFVILLLFDLDYPALWAFLIFLLNYIPYVGSFFATLFPSLLAMLQFGDATYFLYVFGSIMLVQTIMANVVEPKLMGKSLNLSPLTVLFALAFWGYLWGIIGMILAIPIMGTLAIIFAKFPESRYLAIALSENGEIE